MDILKQSVSALLTNTEFYAGQVSGIFQHYISSAQGMKISREEVEQKIQTLQEQKKNVLNAFFNHSITKEDMRLMNEQYDGQLAELSDCLTAVMRQQEKITSLETLVSSNLLSAVLRKRQKRMFVFSEACSTT